MSSVRVTRSGFDEMERDLDEAARDVISEGKKVVGKGCRNMQLDARRRVAGHAHLPHLGRSYTYDVTSVGTLITGEVGAEHERLQGKLDVFIEHGTPTSAPIPHWAPALDAEEPRFYRAAEDLAAKVLGEH